MIDDEAGLVSPPTRPLTWLGLHSELMKRLGPPLVARLRDPLESVGIEIGPPLPGAGMDLLIRVIRECHGCWFQSLRQASRARTHPDAIEQSYRRLELLMRLLAARVTADGGRLVVLVIPTKLQVEPEDERGAVSRAARLLQLVDEDLVYDGQAYARVLDLARRSGLPTIDPLDALRHAATCRRLYYRRDWHLNPDGNRALAAALDEALSEEDLGPSSAAPGGAPTCTSAPAEP